MARIPLPDGPGNERSRLWSLSPTFRDAAGTLANTVYERSSLPLRERELVRFLVARLNGCPI
jgi:hypothetical protein